LSKKHYIIEAEYVKFLKKRCIIADLKKIKKIVLHCSDSPDSVDIGVKDIRRWHLNRGWSDVGYHYIVRRDGRIEKGRDLNTMGAHVRGHNDDSIGVCWVGRKVASDKQLQAIYKLMRGLMSKFNLNAYDIYGHTELDPNKTCPNLDMNFVRLQSLFTTEGYNIDEL
jgi:N-acetylmuramoyl-L-alanine amidase